MSTVQHACHVDACHIATCLLSVNYRLTSRHHMRWTSRCFDTMRTVQHLTIFIILIYLSKNSMTSNAVNQAVKPHSKFLWGDCIITSHSVVWQCCKDDQQSQGEMPYFRGLPAPKPLGRFSKKFAPLITSGTPVTPPNMQVLGSIGSKEACLLMRKLVTRRRLFFSFFTGRQHSLLRRALY